MTVIEIGITVLATGGVADAVIGIFQANRLERKEHEEARAIARAALAQSAAELEQPEKQKSRVFSRRQTR